MGFRGLGEIMRKGIRARHAGGMLIGALVWALNACTQGEVSSANASGDPTVGNGQAPISNGQAVQGQVALGRIAGSNIEVFDSRDLSTPIATTQADASFSLAGQFALARSLFESDQLYLLVASGGNELDADGNGIQDSAPGPFSGRLHAVATEADLLQSNVGISAATEALYRRVLYLLGADMPSSSILAELDARARALFMGTQENRLTALRWRPAQAASIRDGADKLRAFEAALRQGSIDNTLAFELTDAVYAQFDFDETVNVLAWAEQLAAVQLSSTNGLRELSLIDFSTPSDPVLVRTGHSTDTDYLASIAGNVLYAIPRSRAFGASELLAIDLSNPRQPQLLWTNQDIDYASALHAQAGRVYVSSYDVVAEVRSTGVHRRLDGLSVLVDPVLTAGPDGTIYMGARKSVLTLEPAGNSYLQHPGSVAPLVNIFDMTMAGGRLFVSSDSGLTEFELSEPTAPRVAGHYPQASGTLRALSDDELLVESRIVDIRVPGAAVIPPRQAASLAINNYHADQLIRGNRAIVERLNPGTRISLVEPHLEFPLHAEVAVQLPSRVSDLIVDGGLVVVGGMDGIRLYREGLNSGLEFLGSSIEAVQRFRRISLCGNRLSSFGFAEAFFQILDLSEPTAPVAGAYKTPDLSEGPHYFVSSFCDGPVFYFSVFDLSSPFGSYDRLQSYDASHHNEPYQIGDVELSGVSGLFGRTERYAYFPTSSGMDVIDLSNPSAPCVSQWRDHQPLDVNARGTHFSALGDTGFLKFSSTELLKLTLGPNGLPTDSQARQIEMFHFGRYLPITETRGYLASGGLAAVNFDSSRPTPMLELDLGGSDVELLGNQLLIRSYNRLLTVPLIQREVP